MAKSVVKIPGTVLKESYLDVYQLPQGKVAEDTGISLSTIRLLLSGKAKISLNIGLRLSKYFGNPQDYWLDLQKKYDLAELQKNPVFVDSFKKIPKAKKQAPKKAGKAPAAKKSVGRKPAKKVSAKATSGTKKTAAKARKPRATKSPETKE
jgi:addiction module HigA family antidote